MPSIVTAEPQNTGAMEPLLTPWWIPWRISSRVNCSPEKNLLEQGLVGLGDGLAHRSNQTLEPVAGIGHLGLGDCTAVVLIALLSTRLM